MIKPVINYGRTNIYERINDYIISFNQWNIIADIIPYKIYIFENSGYGNVFELNPKITYISERVLIEDDVHGKGKSVALVMKRFIDILNLTDTDKILFINGRYAPICNLNILFDAVEKNDIVVSGLYLDYGNFNTRWHSTTVKMLKEFIKLCEQICNDRTYIYETAFKMIVDKYEKYFYMTGIDIIPTYEGGPNIYRNSI